MLVLNEACGWLSLISDLDLEIGPCVDHGGAVMHLSFFTRCFFESAVTTNARIYP